MSEVFPAFEATAVTARFVDPAGQVVEHVVEVRTDPVTGRTARVTLARSAEKERGTEWLPPPPPDAADVGACPFCPPQRDRLTPVFAAKFAPQGRLVHGDSVLFPNLFPYGGYSAVSLFDDRHFVEIGTAAAHSYAGCLVNCQRYLDRVAQTDPAAIFTAITQNHLPSAGGSLLHPHLQIHADRIAPNFLRYLEKRAADYRQATGGYLFSDLLAAELSHGARVIGRTGDWHWLAAFAPEGFYEVWAILPQCVSIAAVSVPQWRDLAEGITNAQKFYRSRNRNGYNLGLVAVAGADSALELRLRMVVRGNYGPWVRSDHTGYEVMLGDMATFQAPETTALQARPFWQSDSRGG
ncbi:MAG: galactose-1-phosphate uridylyltransferase [Pseudomonadota bacterium]